MSGINPVCLFNISSENDSKRVRKKYLAEYLQSNRHTCNLPKKSNFLVSIVDVIGGPLKSDTDMSDLHSLGR